MQGTDFTESTFGLKGRLARGDLSRRIAGAACSRGELQGSLDDITIDADCRRAGERASPDLEWLARAAPTEL